MTELKRVSFSREREHEPRLSAPRVPGKTSSRYWTDAEKEVLRQHYGTGGAAACMALLPPHRASLSGIYVMAQKLGLRGPKQPRERHRVMATPELDARIIAEWALLDGKKKGEVSQLADRLGVSRSWLSDRAAKLGLTIAHKKEPNWTEAEEHLLERVPLHNPDEAARIFREHGFQRSPTSIVVRSKRRGLSRRATHETLSATETARILGVDGKWVTSRCIDGRLVAGRRGSQRLTQQGGDTWAIRPGDLRQFIVDNIHEIDLRKVEKFGFVWVLAGPQDATDLRRRGATPALAPEEPNEVPHASV